VILALVAGLAGAGATALLFGVPARAWLAVADIGLITAFVGAILGTVLARLRRRPAPWRALALPGLGALMGAAHLGLAPAAPAVILVVVDCLRADRLTAEKMPHTWSFAEAGARFTQARAQSSWTRSAMPSLLSGRYPAEHGLYRTRPHPDRIRPGVTMLAEAFQAGGWLTAAFIEQAQLDDAFGFGRGFDRYGFHDGGAASITRRFAAWNTVFRSVTRFAVLHYLDLHGPYHGGRRYRARDLPTTSLGTRTSAEWRETIRRVRDGEVTLSADDRAHLAGRYDAALRQLDARLGVLYAHLERDGTLARAWVVLTADHGERFGEHDNLEHMGPPDEVVLSVPLVIRAPGAGARVVDGLVQHVDVAPTLLAAAGLPVPSELPGRDLGPALRGERVAPAPSFAEEWWGRQHRASAREGRWKLMHDEGVRLFDLVADPGESQDVAAANPGEVARLEGMLAAYFAAADAGKAIATVDWEAAASSGRAWSPAPYVAGEAADASDETMEALEAMGYLEAGE
jgi:arylsulfatase A-like enzyme